MPAVRPSFRVVAATLLPLLLATCTEDTLGPIGHPGLGQIPVAAVAPNVSQYAGLTITQVRATVTKTLGRSRPDTLLVKTAPFAANSNALTLDLTVPLTQTKDSLDVTLDYMAGALVIFSGTIRVEVTQGPAGTSDPVPIPVTYVGPGATIASINVAPKDSVVRPGSATTFRVTAADSNDNNVPAFYVSWASSSVANPIGADGILHAGTARGTFYVRATTPTGVRDSAQVTIEPAPASVAKVSGDAQSGTAGSALALPLIAEVRGSDNLPVQGVAVAFAVATGGGAVDTASVITGANGRAGTTVRLGPTAGAQSFTATVTGLTPVTFTATAVAAGPSTKTWTGAVSTDWFAAGNWAGNSAPRAVDTVVVPNTTNKPAVNVTDTVAAVTVQTSAVLSVINGASLVVTGSTTLQGTITGVNGNYTGLGPITTTAGSTLSPSVLVVGNTLTVGGTFNVTGNTLFQGTNQQIPAALAYANLSVTGSAALTGRTSVTSSVDVFAGGRLTLGGHTLVTGLLQIGQAPGEIAQLVMTNALDSVLAANVTFQGGDETGSLTAGTIVMTGNFAQNSLNSPTAFAASGSHKVVLSGTVKQTIRLQNGGTTLSHFNILDLSRASGGASLITDTYASQFVALPGAGTTPVLAGTGFALVAPSVNVQRLIVDTAAMLIGGGTITRFDSVTFVHQSPTITMLTVNDPGAATPYVFDDLVFGTTATSGFYIRANDTDGATPNVLTLNLTNPTPATSGGFTQVVNGAQINWPVVAVAATWNGTVSTNWQTAANWTPAGVPGATTAVTIPAGTPNQATLSTNLSSGALTINAGATFNLGTSQLVVNGNALNDGTISANGGNIFMQTGGQVRGGFPFLTVAGPVSAIGPVTVANNLNISGGDYNPNGFYTVVTGALTTSNGGTLTMQSSADSIQANATNFSGASTVGRLTAGVLRVLGDFGQFQGSATFAASGSFTVRMLGATGQLRINDSAASFFQNLDVSAATTLSLVTPIHIHGQLISLPTGAQVPTMSASGFKLSAAGANVTKLIFDTLPVTLGGGTITRFDTVTFNHIPGADTALTINDAGTASPYVFDRMIFFGAPTTGLYIRANDTDGAAPNPLTINLNNPTPAAPGAFTAATNGAVINWPSSAATTVTWTGAVSTDWATAGNWSPARLPTAADSVVIPNAVTNFPTLATTATVAAMFEDGRLTITGGKLHVTRSANANVGINRIIFLTGTTDSVFIGDSTSVPVSGAGVFVSGGSIAGGIGSTGTLVIEMNGAGAQTFLGGAGGVLLRVRKPSGSVIMNGVRVDSLDVNSNIPITGTALSTDHGLFTAGSVTLPSLTVGTSLSVAGAYAVGTTVYQAAAGPIPALPYQNLNLFSTGGAATLTARTTVSGNMVMQSSSGGTVTLNGHTLAVTGTFLSNGINGVRLVMTNPLDSVLIGGSAEFDAGSIANPGNFAAGVMVVGGDFTETNPFGGAKYQGTGTFKTVLTANSPNVHFEAAGTTGALNRFNDLTWTGTGTMTMDSNVVITGTLTTTAAGTVTFTSPSTAGLTLQIGNHSAAGATVFNNVAVNVVQTGTGSAFSLNNATFQGLPTTASQITIQHPGLATPITLNNLIFSVVPTTGFYLTAIDNNPSNGIGLTIEMAGATPTTGGAFVQTANGAVVNWPAAAPTFTWQGATSNWTTGTNWSTGTVPGPTDKVVIAPATVAPIITATTLVGNLTVNTGASLTVNTVDLQVNGNLSVIGTLTGATGGTVVLAGHNDTLSGTVNAPIRMTESYVLAGNLTVGGSNTLDVNSGGIFTVAGHVVNTPRLTVQGNGQVVMTNAGDSVKVSQAAIFNGGDETGLLSAGVLAIGDSFVQLGTTSFRTSGSHRTVFNGAGGLISLADTAASSFQDLDIAPTSGTVRLASPVFVAGNFRRLNATGTLALDSLVLVVQGNVTSAGPMTATNGGLVAGGAGSLLTGNFSGVLVTVTNNRLMTGPTTADILGVAGGSLDLNGQRLTVNTLITSGAGTLSMTSANDTLVTNQAAFTGGSTAGRLTAGALLVSGNLASGPIGAADAFAPSGTFAVVLNGTNPQVVTFATPGPTASHFQDVVIANTVGGVTIDTAYVLGSAGFLPGLPRAQRIIHGFGGHSRIVLSNLNVTQTTFDDLLVRTPVDGSVTLTKFDSVTFSNTTPTDTALVIHHPGLAGHFALRNLIFLTAPTSGLYLTANDVDGITPNTLIVDMVNPSPSSAPGLFTATGGAIVNWPASQSLLWTGAVSSAWELAANWSSGSVPTGIDDVTIQPGTPNSPVVASSAVARNLIVEAGATLDVTSGSVTASGIVSALGQVTGTPSTFVSLTGASGAVNGNFDNLHFDSPAVYNLSGNLTASGAMVVGSGASVTLNGHSASAASFSTSGLVIMTAALDSLITTGAQNWDGADETGRLTAGTIVVGGNFATGNTGTPNTFVATGTNQVVFNGAGISQIVMAAPGGSASRFQNMVANKSGNATVAGATLIVANGRIDVLSGTGQLTAPRIEAQALSSPGAAVINPNYLQISVGDSLFPGAGNFNVDTISLGGGTIPTGIPYRNLRLGASSQNIAPLQLTDGSLIVVGGTFTLGSSVTMTRPTGLQGDILVGGGGAPRLVLNGQRITSQGSLSVTTGGLIEMVNPADSIDVAGNATFDGDDEFLHLTAGSIVVRGALFHEVGSNNGAAYRGTGTHTLVLAGGGNQTVQFDTYGPSTMWNVTVNKSGGTMTFTPGGEADGVTTILSPTAVGATSQYITQGLKIQNAGASFSAPQLQMPVPDSLQVSAGTFSTSLTYFSSGGTVPVAANITYGSLRLTGGNISPGLNLTGNLVVDGGGNVLFNGTASIAGGVFLEHGQLNLNGSRVAVGNGFTSDSNGVLVMNDPRDSLDITGDATFGGGDESGALTAGTLILHGNFQQNATFSTNSFNTNGTHTTVFDQPAGVPQNAFFQSPGIVGAGSHFMNLDVSGSLGGITLDVNSNVEGALISNSTSGRINGGGSTLHVRQLLVSGLTADNVTIQLDEQTVLSEGFDNVTFQNMPATGAVGLVVNGAGGNRNLTFDNVNFPDLPNDGTNFYVRLVSTNGQSFVLDMQDSNQGGNLGPDLSDPANEAVVNGAQVIWRAS